MPFIICKCGEMYQIGKGCPSCGRDGIKKRKEKTIKEKTIKEKTKTCFRCNKKCYGYLCKECHHKKKHKVTAMCKNRRKYLNKVNTKEKPTPKKFFKELGHEGIIKEKYEQNKKGKGIITEKEIKEIKKWT